MRPALTFVAMVAASVWVGGFATVAVVAEVARRELNEADRVAFFRAFGRRFGMIAGIALTLAYASGAVLLASHPWDTTVLAAILLAALLVCLTAGGVVQARAMTRLRQRGVDRPGDDDVSAAISRGARNALVARGAIGVTTLALVAIVAALVD